MAVGKGSMARASKTAAKAAEAVKAPEGAQAARTRQESETSAKAAEKKTSEGVIVYEKSSQMLDRAVGPDERFGIGDAMPVYYF